MDNQIKYILSDIEGTTSSISFVVDELFPYFREHIQELPKMAQVSEVKESFSQVIKLVKEEEGKSITTTEEVIAYLDQWSREDRKVTPLKTLQGFVWKKHTRTVILKDTSTTMFLRVSINGERMD